MSIQEIRIGVVVGSTNTNKINAAKNSIATKHQNGEVVAIPYKADPGIRNWQSPYAGQPFGSKQTAFGAINRMIDCWNHREELGCATHSKTYFAAFENGLVKPIEVGETGQHWFDVCFTALRDSSSDSPIIIKRGKFVKSPMENSDPEDFLNAVTRYEEQIMPLVNRNVDLYMQWTASLPGGAKTRGYFLEECHRQALLEFSLVQEARRIVATCAESGMTASAGPRYRNMLWTRDLAYMAPVYLERGYHKEFLQALKDIAARQCSVSTQYNNGYETFDRYGNVPIVCVPEAKQSAFLRQRMAGWQETSLDTLSLDELKAEYHRLIKISPAPSFGLRKFMEGELENLTPGTRDSEIHYIRAIFALIKHQPALLEEFTPSIERALTYLFTNIIDPDDALPRGCDSRDTFADLLYDSKLLSNAVFWHEALTSLVECKFPFPQKDLSVELQRLKISIHTLLLFPGNQFAPRDFLPGPRTALSLENPVEPTPINHLLKQNRPFLTGTIPDPQGLAHALLAGLIPPTHHDLLLPLFRPLTAFAPISGKTKEETALLTEVKGQVIWPHLAWNMVRALLAINTPASLNLAEEHRDTLMRLGGSGEWYALDPTTQKHILGGDPLQGWSATCMIMAMNDFFKVYANNC